MPGLRLQRQSLQQEGGAVMIHRQNWLDVRAYLTHLEKRLGRDPKTIAKYWNYLRHLIEWADNTPLPHAHRILEPVFPLYLTTARNDSRSTPLSYTTSYKCLMTTRLFYEYSRNVSVRYKNISGLWLETLVPHTKPDPTLEDHSFYSLEELRTIATVSVATLREERAQAGACMLFLSGMRPDTLASIPRQCVDLPNRRLLQKPSLGVRTKNKKSAITYLLNIPELMEVVQRWDAKVSHMAPHALWYTTLQAGGEDLRETSRAIPQRVSEVGEDIRQICTRAGIEYKSPHKFRHGHIVYARSLAKDMDDMKAISQNVLHANVVITDQVYAALTGKQSQDKISKLGAQNKKLDQTELIRLIELLRAQIE
jgi:integrase